MKDELYDLETVAEYLGFQPNTLRIWLRAGRIRGTKIGREWRIAQSEMDYIKEHGTREPKQQQELSTQKA